MDKNYFLVSELKVLYYRSSTGNNCHLVSTSQLNLNVRAKQAINPNRVFEREVWPEPRKSY